MSLQSSIDVGIHVIAQNDHNTILLKWVKKFSKFLPSKMQKLDFFELNNGKKSKMSRKISKPSTFGLNPSKLTIYSDKVQ